MELIQLIGLVIGSSLVIFSVLVKKLSHPIKLQILISGIALATVCQLYPGNDNADTLQMMDEALTGPIHDWHSPLMIVIFRFCLSTFDSRGPFYLFQECLFYCSLYLFAKTFLKSFSSCLLVIPFLLYPPNFAILSQMTKDSFFVTMLFLSAICLSRPFSASHYAVGFLAWICAVGTRHEALFPALVIPFFAFQNQRPLVLNRVLLPIMSNLVLFSISFLLTKALTEKRQYTEQIVYIGDLCGISERLDRIVIPKELLLPGADLTEICELYNGDDQDYVENQVVAITSDGKSFRKLQDAWFLNVSEHWSIYLEDRYYTYCAFLGLGNRINVTLFNFSDVYGNRPNLKKYGYVELGGLTASVGLLYLTFSKSLLFIPAMTFIFDGFVFLHLIIRKNLNQDSGRLALLLSLSGLAHAAILFFVAPGYFFRYGHWMLFSSSLAALICIAYEIERIEAMRGKIKSALTTPR